MSDEMTERGGTARPRGLARAMILAAGLGTRLRPLTDSIPKCLVPIAGRPLLDYWVERLAEAGVREARVNTHAHAEQVRAYLDGVNASGRLRLVESHEPALLGSAGTITANADLADGAEEVIIIYADNFSDVDLGRMLAFHRAHGDPFTMLLFRATEPRACGIAELDPEKRVVSFVEKPAEPKGDLANAGVYIVSAAAYREIAAMRAFDLGYDVLPQFVGRMRGWPWAWYHVDIGTPAALERVRADAPAILDDRRKPGRPAVFLDRDGTIIEQVHYLADPADVRLLPGAAEALKRLRAGGYARVVVTNQSAVGRGIITAARLHEIHEAMHRQLDAQGAAVDAVYYCPDAPVLGDRTTVEAEGSRRKPGPGMLVAAAADLGLDLASSWMVGDMVSDLLAGVNAGCRGSILVGTGKGLTEAEAALGVPHFAAEDLAAAAEIILAGGPAPGGPATAPDLPADRREIPEASGATLR